MIFKDITILDENFEIKDNMYVVTERSCIKYIGKKCPRAILEDSMREKTNF